MLQNFVLETLWLFEIIMSYMWLIKIVWVFVSISVFVVFLYHLQFYYEIDFFIKNVDVLGEFSMASYKIFMILFALFPLIGGIIIVWSVVEGLNSRIFLTRFGCP